MGPDALAVETDELTSRLGQTRRAIKVALLDQSVIAGVGNIYADEALHLARVHPLREANRISHRVLGRLRTAIITVMRAALDSGGSTIRDYFDGTGTPGRYTARHAVYGRGGLPCRRCHRKLRVITLGGRTTVYCPRCQRI